MDFYGRAETYNKNDTHYFRRVWPQRLIDFFLVHLFIFAALLLIHLPHADNNKIMKTKAQRQ